MKWIDTRIENPPINSTVLCFLKRGRMTVCNYSTIFDIPEFIECAICITDYVDYWMYLPNPPKTKNK